MQTVIDDKKYGSLLAEVLPSKINTEKENERCLAIVEKLIDKGAENFSPEEDRLFDLLTVLIEDFEEKAYPMPENDDPVSTMLFLMEQNNLKPSDMIDVFGSRGRVSDVINGRRAISKNHARSLADKFNVSADLFI